MPYDRNANWVDGDGAQATPITAVKLNKVEDGLVAASKNADAAVARVTENKAAIDKAQKAADDVTKTEAQHWQQANNLFATTTALKALEQRLDELKAATELGKIIDGIKQFYVGRMDSGPLVPVGAILAWAGVTAPDNFALCDGRQMDRTAYPQLYSVIQNIYGASGNFFKLPDLKGRVIVTRDQGNAQFVNLNNLGGEAQHILSLDEMPRHSHDIGNPNVANWRDMGIWGSNVSGGNQWNIASGSSEGSLGKLSASDTGGSRPHNNMPPYIVLNYIIRIK